MTDKKDIKKEDEELLKDFKVKTVKDKKSDEEQVKKDLEKYKHLIINIKLS